MDARNNIAQDLFYKIRSRFSGLKLGTETGEITINPDEARFFDFDYMEGENPIGHVSVSLAEPNSMKVYFSHGITESMNTVQKHNWYGFLKELRMFAKRRLLSFDTRDIAKDNLDKRDYVFLSQQAQPKPEQPNSVQIPVGESIMSESAMYGTKTVSYQKLENTRLIIKHSQALTDDMAPGARSRHISALFVENQDGERFKYPFIHLAGARAMQRHVANGGLPYDEIGKSIIGMSEEIAQLRSFGNYVVRNDLMNSANNGIVERSTSYLNTLREQIKALAKQKNYEAYKETFQAQQPVEIPQEVVEQFTDQFTVKNFKEDIKSVFPVLYRLMQESNIGYDDIVAMTTQEEIEEEFDAAPVDPFMEFEEWVMDLGEDHSTEAKEILSNIANEEDWGAVYDLHKALGRPGAEGQAAKIIDDMYSEVAGELGAHADDDFETIYAEVLDRLIDEYGTEIEDPRAYADQSADLDAIAYGQKEAYGDSGWDDPAWEPREPEDDRRVDWDIEAERNRPDEPAREPKTVSIVNIDTGEVVDTFQSTGEFWGDEKKAMKMGYDLNDPESPYHLKWGKTQAENINQEQEKMSTQELAEFIHSFYDKESGTFPKGPEGVCTMVGKKFGEQAESIARKFVERMAPQQADASINELSRIRELAGQQGSVDEARGGADNFTADDIHELEKMDDIDQIKGRAIELISTPSKKPMKPEKISYFKNKIAMMKSKMDIVKLMYDLLLSGEGFGVVGSRNSMGANSYRQRFGDSIESESVYPSDFQRGYGSPKDPSPEAQKILAKLADADFETISKIYDGDFNNEEVVNYVREFWDEIQYDMGRAGEEPENVYDELVSALSRKFSKNDEVDRIKKLSGL